MQPPAACPCQRTKRFHPFHPTPCIDAVGISGTNLTVLGGGATLNNSSFPGFGTALSTLDAGQGGGNVAGNIDASLSPLTLANSAADNVAWSFADPTTGAFTFEALVHIEILSRGRLSPL